jgi:sulfur carrier protein ThiS
MTISPAGCLRNLLAQLLSGKMRFILSDKDVRIFEHSPAPVAQILLEQGINPLEVIVTRNGKLLPEDTIIQGSDEVRIIRIAHGG